MTETPRDVQSGRGDGGDATYVLVLRDGTFAAVPDAEDAIRF